jgi:predicted amidohydrolase
MRRRVLALAQIAPALGDLPQNLAIHQEKMVEGRIAGADLVIFPELSLTGYQLQDLTPEVAMRRSDPRLQALATLTRGGPSAIVSFVESTDDHRCFASAALLEGGEVRHVARKCYLPTYGIFDERRFLAAGDSIRAARAVLGSATAQGEVGYGIGICEDFWHPTLPSILAQDGAELLINVAAGPARGASVDADEGLGSAASWGTLLRATAALTTSYVAFTNRVGVDESLIFWGGSRVIGPDGVVLAEAPLFEEALLLAEIDLDEVARARGALPLLRDERLELTRREFERIIATRAGLEEA